MFKKKRRFATQRLDEPIKFRQTNRHCKRLIRVVLRLCHLNSVNHKIFFQFCTTDEDSGCIRFSLKTSINTKRYFIERCR